MSVLLEFAMFPTDKGESVSEYVCKIIQVVKESGFNFQLTSMGTIIETTTFKEASLVMNKCYKVLDPDCNRVYCTATFDIRKGKSNRMKGKISSIEKRIGEIK